jgi:tight adherence protein C
MSTIHVIFLVMLFIAVTGAILFGMLMVTPSAARRRLRALDASMAAANSGSAHWIEAATRIAAPFSKLAIPDEDWNRSPLRSRFMNAGWRGQNAHVIFFGAKTLLATFLPVVAYLGLVVSGGASETQSYLAALFLSAGLGYYLPNIVLKRLVAVRQREIFETFPDALDLIIVCVEAGLGMDAALIKVAEELRHKSQALSDELHLVTLELRAGASKEDALRNLSVRTGVEDLEALVSTLIQAERFGTSIADSLRVHADVLRTKRRQRAEEKAAKIALKLLFPLIFCIFPSMLLVLLGPAFIKVYRVLVPIITGAHV